MELVIPLSKSGEPFFRQIYKGLRQAILSGAVPSGERLPSTRDLAAAAEFAARIAAGVVTRFGARPV